MNSRRSMTKSSQVLLAMASVERACPSSSAISPKISPGPTIFRIALRPSGRGNAHLHRTRNDRVQAVAGIPFGKQRGAPLQRGVLGVTAELLESLRLEVGKNRVLAQDRQFAARESVSFTRPLLRHASRTPGNTGLQSFRNQRGPAFQPESARRVDLAAGKQDNASITAEPWPDRRRSVGWLAAKSQQNPMVLLAILFRGQGAISAKNSDKACEVQYACGHYGQRSELSGHACRRRSRRPSAPAASGWAISDWSQ